VVVMVVVVMVGVVVVQMVRSLHVLVLLRLLSVFPPFSAVVLMRHHAVHVNPLFVVRHRIIRPWSSCGTNTRMENRSPSFFVFFVRRARFFFNDFIGPNEFQRRSESAGFLGVIGFARVTFVYTGNRNSYTVIMIGEYVRSLYARVFLHENNIISGF